MEKSRLDAGWREIQSEIDIADLMVRFGRFHDGCIREFHLTTGHSVNEELSMSCTWRTTAHLLVQRQASNPSAIELRFEKVEEVRLSPPPPDYVSIISECRFTIHNKLYYWSDDARFDPSSDERHDYSWISARRVWWRDASDWMGDTPRYKG